MIEGFLFKVFSRVFSKATVWLELTPPVVKTPNRNIYENFQINKTLGAKRPKFGVDLGAKRPKKSGFLAFLKGESSKRGSENFEHIKTLRLRIF